MRHYLFFALALSTLCSANTDTLNTLPSCTIAMKTSVQKVESYNKNKDLSYFNANHPYYPAFCIIGAPIMLAGCVFILNQTHPYLVKCCNVWNNFSKNPTIRSFKSYAVAGMIAIACYNKLMHKQRSQNG